MSSESNVPPHIHGSQTNKSAASSSPSAAAEAPRSPRKKTPVKRSQAQSGSDDDEEGDEDAFVTDPLALATMSRSERKRHREKKRRSDVNRGFEDLLQLLVQIDPFVCAEVEDERARRAQLRGDNSHAGSGGEGGGGGASRQASASQDDSNFLSRVDLIERTTRTLRRLHQENEQRKLIIAQFSQGRNARLPVFNETMEQQPQQELSAMMFPSLRRNTALPQSSNNALLALLAGEESNRRDILLRQAELAQLAAMSDQGLLLREVDPSNAIAAAVAQARNEAAAPFQREALLRSLLRGADTQGHAPTLAALLSRNLQQESNNTGISGISELVRNGAEGMIATPGSVDPHLLQSLILRRHLQQSGTASLPSDESAPYLNNQVDPRSRGPF